MRLLVLVVALTLIACSDMEKDEPATQAPTAAPTLEPQPSVAPPTPTQSDVLRVPATLWLLDAANGSRTTLFEDHVMYPYGFDFVEPSRVAIRTPTTPNGYTIEEKVVAFDGTEVSRRAPPIICRETSGGAEVLGRFIADVGCGMVSPTQRWMFYRVEAGEVELGTSGNKVPSWDAWAVDLQGGERFLLQDGLRDCGGCDGRFGPDWSPGGEYIYYAESGGGRVWLSDLRNRTTRRLTDGNNLGQQPRWHPSEDLLLRPSEAETALIDNVRTGTILDLGIAAPAEWDTQGRYVYSPAGASEPKNNEELLTTVVDTRTGLVVARLAGAAAYERSYRRGPSAVAATADGFVAALENAVDCAGTAVYRNSQRVACVSKAGGASISPDGTRVAVSRETGKTGRAYAPTIETVSLTIYEIVVVDFATGRETVVGKDAYSALPPTPLWDRSSSKLLVYWPVHGGL